MSFTIPCNGTTTETMKIERRYSIGDKILSLCRVTHTSQYSTPDHPSNMGCAGGSVTTELYLDNEKVAEGCSVTDVFDVLVNLGVLKQYEVSTEVDQRTAAA